MTLEEILHHHTQALGTQDTLKDKKTMRLTGTYTVTGYEYPITILRKHPDLCRIEVDRDGKKEICIYDGKKAWQKMDKAAQDIEDPLYYCTLLSFSNFDILPNHKSNAIAIKYKGQEKFEGELTHKLELMFNQDKIEHWYINSSTYHLLKVEGRTHWYEGRLAKKTILYMDYKDVQGVFVPFYVYCDITTFSSEVEVQKVEINPDLSSNMFK